MNVQVPSANAPPRYACSYLVLLPRGTYILPATMLAPSSQPWLEAQGPRSRPRPSDEGVHLRAKLAILVAGSTICEGGHEAVCLC